MFDFLKEIYYERKGYDLEEYRQQEEERRKCQEKRTVRAIAGGFAVLFLILAVIGARVSVHEGNILGTIKYIGLGLLEITTVLFYMLKKKKACYICGGLFIALAIIGFII